MNRQRLGKLVFIFLLSFANVSGVFARENVLALFTNEEDSETTKLMVETDDDLDVITKLHKDVYLKNGNLSYRQTFLISDILQQGAILHLDRGKEVIRLEATDSFAAHNGGFVKLDTLYNGVSGKRKVYELELVRAGPAWDIEVNNRPVSKIHFVSKKVFILGTVGIKKLEITYKN